MHQGYLIQRKEKITKLVKWCPKYRAILEHVISFRFRQRFSNKRKHLVRNFKHLNLEVTQRETAIV